MAKPQAQNAASQASTTVDLPTDDDAGWQPIVKGETPVKEVDLFFPTHRTIRTNCHYDDVLERWGWFINDAAGEPQFTSYPDHADQPSHWRPTIAETE